MNLTYVAGEATADLLRSFGDIKMSTGLNGMNIDAHLAPDVGAPLLRALLRVEAELILADAEDLRDDDRELRTPDQRRADAFVALTQRVAEAAKGSLPPAPHVP